MVPNTNKDINVQSNFTTGQMNDIDPGQGHVNYQSRDNAFAKGLVAYQGSEVYMGVDSKTVLQGDGFPGRESVRIESNVEYNHGLFIARFTHMPSNTCSVWPALYVPLSMRCGLLVPDRSSDIAGHMGATGPVTERLISMRSGTTPSTTSPRCTPLTPHPTATAF